MPREAGGRAVGSVALSLAGVILLCVGAARVARVGVFMLDASRTDLSVLPGSAFYSRHSCLSGHFVAARRLQTGVTDVYEIGPGHESATISGFTVDPWLYPPTALLLPRLALQVSRDFLVWRRAWFLLELAGVITAVMLLGRWASRGACVVSLVPAAIALMAPTTLLALQVGNVHLMVFAAAICAMLAFDRGREVVGGALLAWAISTKLFPAILLLVLVGQGRWRAARWTSGWLTATVLGAVVVVGPAPMQAYLTHHLPRQIRGEALTPLFDLRDVAVANDAIAGLLAKLELLNVSATGLPLSAGLAALIGCAAWRLRKDLTRRHRAIIWLSLLQLASLLSPFVPDAYAHFGWLWLLVLLLTCARWRAWRTAAAVAGILLVAWPDVMPAFDSERWRLGLSLARQGTLLAGTIGVVLAGSDWWGAGSWRVGPKRRPADR